MFLADLGIDPQIILFFLLMVGSAIKAIFDNKKRKNQPPMEVDFEDQDLEDLFQQQKELIVRRQQEESELPNGWVEPVQTTPSSPPPIPEVRRQVATEAAADRGYVPMGYEPPQVKKPVLTAAEQAALVQAEKNLSGRRKKARSGSRVVEMLKNPQTARDAIILTEVLGKPKAI